MEEALGRLGQVPRGVGVAPTGKALIELYASKDGKWTILATTLDGNSCIVASGDGWQELNKPDPASWEV